MVATISQEAIVPHPQTRFVTAEAVAQLLNVDPEQLAEIRCWANVILVVGEGMSRFVSYADLPPIAGVQPPAAKDFIQWRKRWRKTKTYRAPAFWAQFYARKIQQAASLIELENWGLIVGSIRFALHLSAVQSLQNLYFQQKAVFEVS